MITTLHSAGLGDLRIKDTTVKRPCWEARDVEGNCIGQLFKVSLRGGFEYWVDGEMEEFASFAEAHGYITGTEV